MFRRVIAACLVGGIFMMGLPAFAGDVPKVVRVGVIPTVSSTEVAEMWKPVLRYLSRRLGVKFKLYTASDYAGIIEALRFKKIEVAYLGPKSYVEAHERANAWAIVREKGVDGSTGYYSIIIAKKGSGLSNMRDLRGKVFAFNDPNSTSGYLVPMSYFLTKLNIAPEKYFSRVIFSGSHEASIMAVKTGKVDVASTNNLDLARVISFGKASKDDFNVIWRSKLIPGAPIAVRGDLPYDFVQRFRKAFLEIPSRILTGLQLSGYVQTDDSDYDPIREIKKVIKRIKK